MDVHTASEHAWHRRVTYFTALVLLLQIGLAAWLGWRAAHQLGLTLPEAQAVAYVNTTEPLSMATVMRRFFVAAPLTDVLVRVAATQVETLWRARAPFWVVSVLCLAALVRIARTGGSSQLTMLWTALLGGVCAQWWLRTHQIGPVLMTTWGVLMTQWGWHYLRSTLRWYAVLVYGCAALAGIFATPYAACVLVVHALWWLAAVIHSRHPAATDQPRVSSDVVITALQIAVVLAALPVVFNAQTFVFKTPAWLSDPMWWRDVAATLWTTVCAVAGSSYAAIPVWPSQHVWQTYSLAYGVTLAVVLLAVVSCVRSWRAAGDTRMWCGVLLALPFIWTGLTARYTGAECNQFVSVAWPFVVLLVADACAWLTARALAFGAQVTRVGVRRACYAVIIGAAVALWLLWWHAQRTAYAVALHAAGDADLATPATLLKRCVHPTDQMLLVCPHDPTRDERLRWYLAPLFQSAQGAPTPYVSPHVVTNLLPQYVPSNGVLWLVNYRVDATSLTPWGLTNIAFRYAVPLEYVCRTNELTPADVGRLYRRALQETPLCLALRQQFMAWYTGADHATLCELIVAGQAQKDLASTPLPPLRTPRRGAANAALYAWSRQYPQACGPGLYTPFDAYVSALGPAVLDGERVIYLYRLHIEQALAHTNIALARAALEAARRWDDDNPYLNRLAAQLCLLEHPTAYARARRLNARAARTFERRYGRPFIEALFANMLLDKQEQQPARAMRACAEVLHHVQNESFIPLAVRTNTAPGSDDVRAAWQRQRLFWEAQCHSYLALLLLSTGDYNNAVGWLSRNLDPRFDDVRRTAAYEQLARLYTESGDITRALRHFETLAALATSAAARIHSMLQAAQLHVTAGDTVAAHELWLQLQDLVNELDNKGRHDLVRNKQYQRLMRHVERRMNLDGRDVVILALQSRAQHTPDRAAWYYRQMAHIERSRLQYDRADMFFNHAMQAVPVDPDAYLDAAIYYYRRLQYPRASAIISNLHLRISAAQRDALFNLDWRYAVLAEFYARGIPTPETNALAWLSAAVTNFAEPAAYFNAYGHLCAFYDHFDAATNAFHLGIATNTVWLDNYLDLGYLLCTQADSDTISELLDVLDALPTAAGAPRPLYGDWRHVIMHHVSIRPYLTDKDFDED